MPRVFTPARSILALFTLLMTAGLGTAGLAYGAGGEGKYLPGAELNLVWSCPLSASCCRSRSCRCSCRASRHHFGKVSLGWAVAFLLPCLIVYGWGTTSFLAWETVAHEYLPFIILLFALFTISGGVRIKGSLVGTPALNTGILAIGTVLASFMGTTGAAMLLIRPLCRSNDRKHRVHTIVFFIFLVANIGGSLSRWVTAAVPRRLPQGRELLLADHGDVLPDADAVVLLLGLYYIVDTVLSRREGEDPADEQHRDRQGRRAPGAGG